MYYSNARDADGATDLTDWNGYRDLVFPVMLDLQEHDGLWRTPDAGHGAVYNTAMALIVLQTANAYLSTFPR